MITREEVEKLANLARIRLNDGEKDGLAKEIDSILAYVDQIKSAKISLDQTDTVGEVKNVTREDLTKTVSAEDRERLLDEAPDREGDFVAVKKIL